MKYQLRNGGEVVEAIQWQGSGTVSCILLQDFDPKGYRNDCGFGPDWFLTSSKMFAHIGSWIVKFPSGFVVPVADKDFTCSGENLDSPEWEEKIVLATEQVKKAHETCEALLKSRTT